MLRTIPNAYVARPADFNETIGSYNLSFRVKNAPVSIVLTRQNCENLGVTDSHKTSEYGGYIC
jgi:transketolase